MLIYPHSFQTIIPPSPTNKKYLATTLDLKVPDPEDIHPRTLWQKTGLERARLKKTTTINK